MLWSVLYKAKTKQQGQNPKKPNPANKGRQKPETNERKKKKKRGGGGKEEKKDGKME